MYVNLFIILAFISILFCHLNKIYFMLFRLERRNRSEMGVALSLVIPTGMSEARASGMEESL